MSLCRRRLLQQGLPLLLGSSLCTLQTARAALRPGVVYPRIERDLVQRSQYPLQLLQQALQASGADLALQPSQQMMLQGRALLELQADRGAVDVVWSMTSREREQELLPIRIPICKGLFGYRLLLLQRGQLDAQRLLDEVASLDDLGRHTLLQGHDWPDTTILRANGLRVQTGTSVEALLHLLQQGRGLAFPRAVLEVDLELAAYAGQVRLERGLALRYPTAVYFFVRKGAEQLARQIELGLEQLIANGGFERLFQRHFGGSLQRHLARTPGAPVRRVFDLHNPLLPPKTPLHRRELWHQS